MSDAAYLAFDHSSETTLTDVVNSVFTRRRIIIANDSLAMVFLVQIIFRKSKNKIHEITMHGDNRTISLLVSKGAQIQRYVVFENDCEFTLK